MQLATVQRNRRLANTPAISQFFGSRTIGQVDRSLALMFGQGIKPSLTSPTKLNACSF
jgi:hypothetical protein